MKSSDLRSDAATLTLLGLLTLFLAVPFLGSGLDAQVRLVPQVGLYAPISDLGQVEGAGGAVDIGKKESTVAYGGHIEFGGGPGTTIRVGGLYAPQSDVPLDGVGCVGCGEARSTLLALSAALVLRPIDLPLVDPYLIGGAGIKRYDFDFENFDDQAPELFDDQSKFTGQLGIGAELGLGSLRITGELSDYISQVEVESGDGDLQHDFFFTLGLVLGG